MPLADALKENTLEGARLRSSPNGFWGPKTASDDAPWYIPESKIGEWPYRYQGVITHGALAALPFGGVPGLINFLLNGGYALGTQLAGRTAPVKRVHLPPPQYPPPLPDELANRRPQAAYPPGGAY